MPAPGVEKDLNFERRGDLRRAFSLSKARASACRPSGAVLGNDLHKNKDPKHAATCFRRPQNFPLPMTLK
jgi:hypothetical protein